MKSGLILAAVAMLVSGGIAEAQTSMPSADANQNLTPAQQARREHVQGERQTCRTQAQGQGVKGPAMRAAVLDCMAKVDPMAAKRMGCAQSARSKGLAGDDMKNAVRACMTGAG